MLTGFVTIFSFACVERNVTLPEHRAGTFPIHAAIVTKKPRQSVVRWWSGAGQTDVSVGNCLDEKTFFQCAQSSVEFARLIEVLGVSLLEEVQDLPLIFGLIPYLLINLTFRRR